MGMLSVEPPGVMAEIVVSGVGVTVGVGVGLGVGVGVEVVVDVGSWATAIPLLMPECPLPSFAVI